VKVLVAYASKYGSTKGIADFIGEKLRQQGMQVDVQEVSSVKNTGDYDAFVIGSAVYMFHWLKEAKQFLSKNSMLMLNHPVWLFSILPGLGPREVSTDRVGMSRSSSRRDP
jgi:menaquinone-dependent protoporphyrinogen oxidase